jgi:2-iminobutanoate/2-iminopropanoate deaminase
MKKIITSNNAPKAIGPYSQAIVLNNVLYTSGQIGLDPQTGDLKIGIEEQVKQVMENLKALLKEADMDFSNVVKTTIFLKSMEDFALVNQIYASYFNENPPARSCVEVSALPKGALVEIELIAH